MLRNAKFGNVKIPEPTNINFNITNHVKEWLKTDKLSPYDPKNQLRICGGLSGIVSFEGCSLENKIWHHIGKIQTLKFRDFSDEIIIKKCVFESIELTHDDRLMKLTFNFER